MQVKRPYTAAQVVALRGHLRTSYASGVFHSHKSSSASQDNDSLPSVILVPRKLHAQLFDHFLVLSCRRAGKETMADSEAQTSYEDMLKGEFKAEDNL